MCINFATPMKAKRGAVKFRRRFDEDKRYQYRLVQGKLIVSGKIVWHIAVHGWVPGKPFLTYV